MTTQPLSTVRRGRIVYVGNFWPYFGTSLLLLLGTILTLGILGIYWAYWSLKYFFAHMEIEIEA